MLGIKPIKRISLTDQVIDSLKEYISSNNLVPGDRLPSERELVGRLGVSKTILREALKSLEAVGIIDIRGGGGIYVVDMDYPNLVSHISFALMRKTDEFRHLARAREILEVGALEDVIRNITEDDIHELEATTDRFKSASTAEEVMEADRSFHEKLISITGNPMLVELCSFFDEFFVRAAPQMSEEIKTLNAIGHQKLLQSLKDGDLKAAEAIFKDHCDYFANHPEFFSDVFKKGK